jgi:hypothetical protein
LLSPGGGKGWGEAEGAPIFSGNLRDTTLAALLMPCSTNAKTEL